MHARNVSSRFSADPDRPNHRRQADRVRGVAASDSDIYKATNEPAAVWWYANLYFYVIDVA
jgi:hypothetical protein